jgi:hypothetical protein
MYSRVFSEEASHEFPPSQPWDHAIELKPGVPAALPGKLIPLSQAEQVELRSFIKNIQQGAQSDLLKALTSHGSSTSKRKTANFDQYKITDLSTNGPYATHTHFC